MSERGFENAPDLGQDFAERSNETRDYDASLEYDAQDWEPTEEPSEKHLEMHYTPGGTLEQEVHTQFDEATRARIREVDRELEEGRDLPDEQELNFAGDFDEASGTSGAGTQNLSESTRASVKSITRNLIMTCLKPVAVLSVIGLPSMARISSANEDDRFGW